MTLEARDIKYQSRFFTPAIHTNMQSGYTCLRCLNTLQSGATLSRLSRGFGSFQNSRWISTPGKQPTKRTRGSDNSHSRRTASSLGYQGQYAKNEPVEVRSPPGLASTPPPEVVGRVLLQPDNLFHTFSNSPSPEIRRRAALIKSHAYCPHPSHRQTRLVEGPNDPEARKTTNHSSQPPAHVRFECPDCGIPVSCSEEHWADDYESHLEICDTLREINEDDHDLRSGRFFPEFEYPGPQMEEALVNMTNWDTYLYSREFKAINEARSMRQATRLLTYPVTIGSVLHELSPYSIRRGGRLTTEGLKSLSGTYFESFR